MALTDTEVHNSDSGAAENADPTQTPDDGIPANSDALSTVERGATATPCRHCGTRARHTDRTGCCSRCRRLFRGLKAFDRHWTTTSHGKRTCVDPATLTRKDGTAAYETVPVAGGEAWRLIPRGDRGRWWETDGGELS